MKRLAIETATRQELDSLGYFKRQDQQQRTATGPQALADRMASVMQTVRLSPQADSEPRADPCPTCLDHKIIGYNVPVNHPQFGKVYPCPTCQGATIQRQLDSVIQSAGIAPRHRFTFEEFWQLPDVLREGKQYAAECLTRFQSDHALTVGEATKRGIVLYGKFGTCKTTLASSALIAEAQAGGAVLSVNFAALLDDVQDAYSRADVKSEDIIRAAQRAPFALLDDLGDPRASAELSADKIRITHKVLDYRNDYMLPTIITTNCSADQLKRQITPRTFERLRELCYFIEVGGENLRQ